MKARALASELTSYRGGVVRQFVVTFYNFPLTSNREEASRHFVITLHNKSPQTQMLARPRSEGNGRFSKAVHSARICSSAFAPGWTITCVLWLRHFNPQPCVLKSGVTWYSGFSFQLRVCRPGVPSFFRWSEKKEKEKTILNSCFSKQSGMSNTPVCSSILPYNSAIWSIEDFHSKDKF